jgi:hypothetical protein
MPQGLFGMIGRTHMFGDAYSALWFRCSWRSINKMALGHLTERRSCEPSAVNLLSSKTGVCHFLHTTYISRKESLKHTLKKLKNNPLKKILDRKWTLKNPRMNPK